MTVTSDSMLDHIAAQIQFNVDFLQSEGYMSPEDAATMSGILANISANPQAPARPPTVRGAPRLPVPLPPRSRFVPTPVIVVSTVNGDTPPPSLAPPPPPRQIQMGVARALWAYNENGAIAEDLSFSAGDMIEIISKENDDWWMGRFRSREGLFPSNHVEAVGSGAVTSVVRSHTLNATQPTTTKVYKPFGAALHGTDVPPSGNGVNSVGLQEAPGKAEKQSTLNKYKGTMANSAAGGLGFGAGAAIGGGLVRAIF